MTRTQTLVLMVLAGCSGDASGPAAPLPLPPFFVGGGIVSLMSTAAGCEVLWHARANDTSVVVAYEVGYEDWRRGTFKDSVRVRFIPDTGAVRVDPMTLVWSFTAGSYSRSSSQRIRQDVQACWVE